MRSLNLSRLARASEGSFFKDQQTTQAAQIRKTLSDMEVASLKAAPSSKGPPTVDTLASISGQSAYRRIVQKGVSEVPVQTTSPLATRIARAENVRSSGLSVSVPERAMDPTVTRALGGSRLHLYSTIQKAQLQAPQTRALPGGDKYGEGAVMGMASLSIASAIVASVGLTGGLVVYFNPGVVDYAREGTRRFGKSIDNSLGKRIRERVDGIKKRGPIVSEERQDAYGKLLGHAVGMKTREVSEQSHNSAEET